MIESQHNLLGKIHSTFVDKAPQVLGITLRCIPFNLKKQVIEQLLQLQFKHSLEDGDLDFLENRWLKIEVTDLQLIWFVSLIENKLVVSREEIADVSFIGNANDLIMIATRRQDPDTGIINKITRHSFFLKLTIIFLPIFTIYPFNLTLLG
ncbi:ubiquinone anaerobic biosynthesis accessory factor UbiT [Gilliamella apicola]|uniref:ubiquinone anaerobic biosynthesis accessory factor UbiT n=1 Tax=Gilliamella apicola TaxID=1196095 RepID=UPI000A33E907|nr:SCP2 sterol-binding domain-containing protein [Gilliamella apicola]OTP98452.1 hypothetical protein B6D07_13050 [Gilliamella apicola]